MTSLGELKNYVKRHPTVQGKDGNYLSGQFDDISQSINLLNDALTGLIPLALLNIAPIADQTFLGNISGATAAPLALTATQVADALPNAASAHKGAVPATGTPSGKFLRDDSTWQAVSLAGLLVASNNLSDLTNFGTARSNLGLVIGTNVQAFDPQLHSNIPGATQNNNYTFVLTDGEGYFYHGGSTGHTWTIPDNASVAYPSGTCLTFVVTGTGAVTLAIAGTDTLVQAGTGSTGSRTLNQYAFATAMKVDSTTWFISGSGVS